MYRENVKSSNIASIGYEEEVQTLEIEFINGDIYQYFDVPRSVYQELMSSASHGRYLNQYIKGTYRCE